MPHSPSQLEPRPRRDPAAATLSLQALHQRLSAGDLEAGETLFRPLVHQLRTSVRRLVPAADADLVEMSVVDTVFQYYRAPALYVAERSSLLTYLARIAKNKLIDRFRKDRLRRTAERVYASAAVSVATTPEPESSRQLLRRLLNDPRMHSERHLIMAWMRGVPRGDLAALLGVADLSNAEQHRIVRNKIEALRLRLKRCAARI